MSKVEDQRQMSTRNGVYIVQGEMSLVGPRPWPRYQYIQYIQNGFLAKKKLKGGLCGPAQALKGTSETMQKIEEEKMIKLYKQSNLKIFIFDIKMIFKTFIVCFKGEGY